LILVGAMGAENGIPHNDDAAAKACTQSCEALHMSSNL
jgi:hypothetical protein